MSKSDQILDETGINLGEDRVSDEFKAFLDRESTPYFNEGINKPAYVLQKEKAKHRFVAYLLAQGMTATEIAQKEGWSPVTINYWEKQPWMIKLVRELSDQLGKRTVLAQLHGKAAHAAQILMDSVDPSNPLGLKNKDRVEKAHEFLDRIWGKSTQPIEQVSKEASELTDDELAKIASGQN